MIWRPEMQRRRRWSLAAVVVLGLGLAACTAPTAKTSKVEAVVVEAIDGTDLERLALTAKAAERLGISTAPVGSGPAGGAQRTVIPYSAVVYDADGATWTYTNPENLVFIRHEITVDHIADQQAVLSSGPELGTLVVTVGAAELWGVETGVGGGH